MLNRCIAVFIGALNWLARLHACVRWRIVHKLGTMEEDTRTDGTAPTEEVNGVADGEGIPGPEMVMFEGETYEVVEFDDDEDPGEDDESSQGGDYDNVEEDLGEGFDSMALDGDDGDSEQQGEAGPDVSLATLGGHADSVYSVAMHRDSASGKIRALTGGGDDVGMLWRLDVMPTDESDTTAAAASSGAAGGGSSSESAAGFTAESAFPNPGFTVAPTPVATLGGHTDSVGAVAFSCDGSLCATGGLDGIVQVWDSDTGSLKRSLEGPSDVEWLKWHSKGNVLLCGSSDGTVWMWLATTGACMQVFAGHEGAVTCGLFTPDGRAVVTGGADATVRIWAPKKGTCKHVFQGHGFHDGGVTCLAAHPLFDATGAAAENSSGGDNAEHSLVASGAEDGHVKLMHVGTKKVVASFNHSVGAKDAGASIVGAPEASGEAFSVEAVGLCGAQPWLASAGIDGTAKVWDVTTGRLRQTLNHPRSGAVTKLAWHEHSPLLVTAAGDGVVRCWDARTGGDPIAEMQGHKDMVVDLATCFGPDRRSMPAGSPAGAFPDLLLTACDDRTAKVWSVPSLS